MCKIKKREWGVWSGKIKTNILKSEKEFLDKVVGLKCPESYLSKLQVKLLKNLDMYKPINLQDLTYESGFCYTSVICEIEFLTSLGLATSAMTKQHERLCYLTESGANLKNDWLKVYRRLQELEGKSI